MCLSCKTEEERIAREYQAPKDFTCMWYEDSTVMRRKIGYTDKIEKLFTYHA